MACVFQTSRYLPRTLNVLSKRFLASSSNTLQRPRLFEANYEVQDSLAEESIFTEDHVELRRNIRKFIDKEINPYVEEWEEQGAFPGHELFKKLGNAGYLGVNKPVEYGGMGLDFSYAMALHEEFGMYLYTYIFLDFSTFENNKEFQNLNQSALDHFLKPLIDKLVLFENPFHKQNLGLGRGGGWS